MKQILSMLAAFVTVGVLFVVALYLLQERLIYLPARSPLASMVSGGLRAWPSASEFRGLLAEPAGALRGTVVVFHGNAGHAGHRGFYAEALLPLGWRAPVALMLAERDSIVPARLGRALHDALPTKSKRLFVLPGADHNDWPDRVDAAWWREVIGHVAGG